MPAMINKGPENQPCKDFSRKIFFLNLDAQKAKENFSRADKIFNHASAYYNRCNPAIEQEGSAFGYHALSVKSYLAPAPPFSKRKERFVTDLYEATKRCMLEVAVAEKLPLVRGMAPGFHVRVGPLSDDNLAVYLAKPPRCSLRDYQQALMASCNYHFIEDMSAEAASYSMALLLQADHYLHGGPLDGQQDYLKDALFNYDDAQEEIKEMLVKTEDNLKGIFCDEKTALDSFKTIRKTMLEGLAIKEMDYEAVNFSGKNHAAILFESTARLVREALYHKLAKPPRRSYTPERFDDLYVRAPKTEVLTNKGKLFVPVTF